MGKVIIDGVNVSECDRLRTYRDWTYSSDKWCGISNDGGCECNQNPDCYYKQLQRAKAENERLKDEIKEVKKYQYEQEYLEKEIETAKVNLDIGKEEAKHYLHEAYKFQKCLQEIREMATLFHSVNENKGLDRFKNNILDKINSVIGAK